MMTKRIGLILWIGCILGTWAILPFFAHFGLFPPTVSWKMIVIVQTIQSAILYGVLLAFSAYFLNRVDLRPFEVSNFWRQVLLPGILGGLVVGGFHLTAQWMLQPDSGLIEEAPPFWKGALAAVFGGINQEVAARLFFLTTIYFVFRYWFPSTSIRNYLLWTAIGIAALFFGLIRLLLAAQTAELSGWDMGGIFLIQAVAGAVFGWLYSFYSFWAAVLAHFLADLLRAAPL